MNTAHCKKIYLFSVVDIWGLQTRMRSASLFAFQQNFNAAESISEIDGKKSPGSGVFEMISVVWKDEGD